MHLARVPILLALCLLLASCLTPGRFVSTLDIKADRSFTFTYAGEVVALDLDSAMRLAAEAKGTQAAPAVEGAAEAAKGRAIAATLAQEEGYRSVEYLGNMRFRVDYSVSGRLDRSFAYPLNLDAKAVFPWIMIELRNDSTVRVSALAFGDPDYIFGRGEDKKATNMVGREGIFTLTTDAALVSHDNGGVPASGPGTKIVWRISPATSAVPTAIVRFAK